MQAVLDQLDSLKPKPIETLSAEEARKQPTPTDAVHAQLKKQKGGGQPEQVASVTNRTIPVKGGSIPIRIYRPEGNSPFPLLVYYPGGGWVLGNLDTYDASARALAKMANVIVVSAGYRQAPEHKFPTAHSDAFNAYRWVVAHAKSFGGDPSRVAVGGESAGGNLAGAVAMMARDSNVQVPAHQLLVYPIAGHDLNTPSYQENATAKPLNKPMMEWYFTQYLRGPDDAASPLIDLVHAPTLKGLPPATVITADIDPLRSEGAAYAKRLKDEGVNVDYRNYRGLAHEFFGMGSVVTSAKDAELQAAEGLKKSLGVASTGSVSSGSGMP
jgi:acetyl esterase